LGGGEHGRGPGKGEEMSSNRESGGVGWLKKNYAAKKKKYEITKTNTRGKDVGRGGKGEMHHENIRI